MEEDESFIGLTVHEKILYWFLQSQFNLHGKGWYIPDRKLAVATSMSLSKARQARRKFKKEGWLEYEPGFRSAGRNVATKYNRVQWAGTPEKDSGESWIPMHRYTLEAMMGDILTNELNHKDVVTYIVLYYWYQKHRDSAEENGWWFISKKDLRALTGITGVAKCIRNLYARCPFASGNRLFEFKDELRRYTFTSFHWFGEPSESEANFRSRQKLWDDIERRYELERQRIKDVQERQRIHDQVKPEELGEYWKWLSGQTIVYDKDIKLLADWASEFGVKTMCKVMDDFAGMYGNRVSGPTLSDFKKHWKKQLEEEQNRPSWLPRDED